jgi:hypothetical protein
MKNLKRFLVLSAILIGFIAYASTTPNVTQSLLAKEITKTDSCYICVSKGAVAYHSDPNCRGLAKCTHTISKISVDDAVNNYNRRACKICYK